MDSLGEKYDGINFLQNWCCQPTNGSRLDLIGTLLTKLAIKQRQETLYHILKNLKEEAFPVVAMALDTYIATWYTGTPFLEDAKAIYQLAAEALSLAEEKNHAGFSQVFSGALVKLDKR